MTFQEAERFVFEQLPTFSKSGRKAIKVGHDNIYKLCAYLGNPQDTFKSIHVAGTNGKGSTCHILSAIFTDAGYKTGLYTSPHLSDIRERCRIDGAMVSEALFVEFVEKVQPLLLEIEPSYFELNVALAFYAFAQEKVDIAIIETGLGGRLDSTNIISPILSIITHIALDHTDILGDTLELIAAEKAGIIKTATPVIIGKRQDAIESVFTNKALALAAPIFFAEDILSLVKLKPSDTKAYYKAVIPAEDRVIDITTDLLGGFQIQNIRTALTAIYFLSKHGWNLDIEQAVDALQRVKPLSGLKGRWDYWNEHIILDVAHNPDGALQIVDNLQSVEGKKYFLFGAVKDKDVAAVIASLPVDAHYLLSQAQVPRAKPVAELATLFMEKKLSFDTFETVEMALDHYFEKKEWQDGTLIIFGSFFIVGEAYQYLEKMG